MFPPCLSRIILSFTAFGLYIGYLHGSFAAPVLLTPVPETNYCANFNSGIPAGMTLFGSATVNGGFLKLTDASGGLGVAYLNDFNGGQKVTAFQATFIAALFGSTC